MYRKRRDFRTEMQQRGWEFMPTGPNEWSWLKFDKAGKLVAQQGDKTWKKDIDDASP